MGQGYVHLLGDVKRGSERQIIEKTVICVIPPVLRYVVQQLVSRIIIH